MQKSALIGMIAFALGVIVMSACVATPDPTEASPIPRSNIALGGMMYDNWMKVIGVEVPEGEPPLWKTQTTNTRTGADAWRCKECHGWDYKGAEGAYGSGSHRTGFKGLMGAASMADEDLLAWLNGTKNPDHDFSPYIQEAQLKMLVTFLKKGMTDTAQYINIDKTINSGDAEHGKVLFTEVCEKCHGKDGKTFNFGDESAPEYLGTIATDNPWEFWHKVSFGQPGEEIMPSGLDSGWGPQDFADLLSFVQTLPSK